MALKDWRMASSLSYLKRWNNRITGESLMMKKEPISDPRWAVWSWKLPVRRFDTMSHAMRFAKEYMRSH